MNERIRLLAEQAGDIEAHYESDHGPFVPAEFNKEKFAELIVQECLGMLDDEDDYGPYSTGICSAAYRIKQHFGVKE